MSQSSTADRAAPHPADIVGHLLPAGRGEGKGARPPSPRLRGERWGEGSHRKALARPPLICRLRRHLLPLAGEGTARRAAGRRRGPQAGSAMNK